LQEKDWSKLSSPNPSAKSRFVAGLPEPQVENSAFDESSDSVEENYPEIDASDDSSVESDLEVVEQEVESVDQLVEYDLSESGLPEDESEQDVLADVGEVVVRDVSNDELSSDTIPGEAPLEQSAEAESSKTEVDDKEIAQSEADQVVEQEATLAEQPQLEDDLRSERAELEITESEISELIVAQQNEDSEVNLSLPALHLPETESETSPSESSIDGSATLPTEITLSSDQPIAEFVSHKLINMEIKHIVEAALFASGSAMSVSRLYRVFDEDERPERSEIRAALTILQQDYADKAVQLVEVAGGFRFQVKADYAFWIARLFEERPPKYSRALLETLSIVAYRQPVTRGDIENIRGVSVSTQIIQTLQEREWVKIVGHKEVPGKPALFATTAAFLDYFNLKSLTDLPPLSEFIIPDEIPEQSQDASIEDEIDQQSQQAEENQANQTQSVASDTPSD
jgi:segregation and condensation protein B